MAPKALLLAAAASIYQVFCGAAAATDISIINDMNKETKTIVPCASGYDKMPGIGRRAGMISCDQLDYGTFQVKARSGETITCKRSKFSVFDTGFIQQCYVATPAFVTLHNVRQRCGKSVVFHESGELHLCWN